MASLNEFIDPDLSTSDVLHSSGYVSASGIGGGMGGLSMEKRREQLNKPRIVGSYQHSHLGRRYGAAKARTADQKAGRVYDASTGGFSDKAQMSNRQGNSIKDPAQVDASITKRQHFIEPPTRRHDPYA
ncbi:hypothetical protein HY312_02300 [Candidatus Saccharibacteria bacterium]|nr:hypothetical protein [Candidatus Saccharibacteria bacterium]